MLVSTGNLGYTNAYEPQEGTFSILEHTEVTTQQVRRPPKQIAQSPERAEGCHTVTSVLALVGDKWSVMIIVTLGSESKRFNAIKREVGGISQRMLTLTLRGLERDGLVTRTQFPTIPPRVDYALTALGCSLLTVVRPLGDWALAHLGILRSAREKYDSLNDRKLRSGRKATDSIAGR
jgi:DNA-binding HxlR family transcriptional regulator